MSRVESEDSLQQRCGAPPPSIAFRPPATEYHGNVEFNVAVAVSVVLLPAVSVSVTLSVRRPSGSYETLMPLMVCGDCEITSCKGPTTVWLPSPSLVIV